MGGPLGRKGTDDPETVREALRRGVRKRSPERAARALRMLSEEDVIILAPRGEMGEISIASAGLEANYVPLDHIPSHPSSREDTIRAAREMAKKHVDLLLFSGGDGTALDILKAVNHELVVLGIPSGVKVFSSVFAKSPEDAGRIAGNYLRGDLGETLGEVLDIPEDSYRRGTFSVRVAGTLRIPASPLVQGSKSVEAPDEVILEGIYRYIRERIEGRGFIVLGPGRTVSYVAGRMGYEKNPSTVDVLRRGEYIRDVDYFKMEALASDSDERPLIILTPIGGTSFLLGRGNQQLIPAVRRADWAEDMLVISTPAKLRGIRELVVDVDEPLPGVPNYIRVITGYREERMIKIVRAWASTQ